MTNKEAIEILSVIRRTPSVDVFNTLPNTTDSCIDFDYRSALDLAIKALEEYPTDKEIQDDMRRTYLQKLVSCGY